MCCAQVLLQPEFPHTTLFFNWRPSFASIGVPPYDCTALSLPVRTRVSLPRQVKYYENGTYVITCPDLSLVTTESCSGSTNAEALDCCKEVCL